MGGAIANIAAKDGISVQVLPGAGIANVRAVAEGKADIGFANSISTVDGVNGRAPFESVQENVCNVGTLYPQYFQIVVNADSGIEFDRGRQGPGDRHPAQGQHRRSDQRPAVRGLRHDL